MKLGVRDDVLSDGGWEARFAEARELGLAGLEITVLDPYGEHLLWQEGGVDRINRLRAEYGVEVCSLSLDGWRNPAPGQGTVEGFFAEQQAGGDGATQPGVRQLQEAIRICRELGASAILVPFFGRSNLPNDDALVPHVVAGLRACAALAEECGVYLAVESLLDAQHHLDLVRAVGSSHVGVYYDVANAASRDYDPEVEFRLLGRHLVQVHLKDSRAGYPATGVPLGTGRVRFEGVRAGLAAIGYDGYLILEVRCTLADKRSLGFARELFGL